MPRQRKKLTADERRKRAAKNERRGRKSERKSHEPTVVKAASTYGARIANGRRAQESSQRAIKSVVDHSLKWKDTPPCDCGRCVARRKLEAEFKAGKKQLVRR